MFSTICPFMNTLFFSMQTLTKELRKSEIFICVNILPVLVEYQYLQTNRLSSITR